MMGEYDAGYENCIDAMVRQMEDMQFSIDSLHRENAKLRELCKRVLKNCYDAYEQVWGWDDDWVILCDEARELGVEVDDD